jgi:hypothetical protein
MEATGLGSCTPGSGLDAACAAYGATVLILLDASIDAVRVHASVRIREALLYATSSVINVPAAQRVTSD